MRNVNPCRNCRMRRRKCVWEIGDLKCERCELSGTECIPCPSNEINLGIRDGSEQLLEWWNQVMKLEAELNTARDALFLDKSNSTRTVTPVANGTRHGERQWTLRIMDGRVQLESNIKDYQELMMYHQASLRYLSPLAGLIQRENIQFDGISISAIVSANLAIRCNRYQPRRQQIMMIEQQQQQKLQQHNYRHEMAKLITIYMKTYNQIIGTLHEPSFIDHFNRIENPLYCPTALTTCIDAIAYLYPQLPYSSLEKRQWAEFFYNKYKEILFDMYHDPDCRLEVVTTTTLVLQYLIDIVMDFTEARRMITMALLICNDLDENTMSRIDLILFHRHRTCLQLYDTCMNFYLEGKIDFSGIQVPDTELLEGESDQVVKYLMACKSVIELIGSPYMTSLMQKVNLAIHGEPCEISLDMILEFETTLQEFWKSLPKIFKICDDPFTSRIGEVMNGVTNSICLIPFAALHCISGVVQSSMLKPCFVNANGSSVGDNMARIIRDKAESMAITSIKALAYVMKRNLEIGVGSIPLSIYYMFGALQAVCSIKNHSADVQIQHELSDALSKCFIRLNMILPGDHQLPQSISPLEALMKKTEENTSKLMDIYDMYPLPGFAMTSDMLFTCFNQLGHGSHYLP